MRAVHHASASRRYSQLLARVRIQLRSAPRLPVEHDRHVGGRAIRPGDVAEVLQDPAERRDIAEHTRVLAPVGHHRRVELLGAGRRLAPLEIADRVSAVRDVRERIADQLAGPLRPVHGLPVHGARGVLHEEPRPVPREPARERRRERELVAPLDDVVVVRDEVDLARHLRVVGVVRAADDHEVRRDGDIGRDAVQNLALGHEVVDQGVGLRNAGSRAAASDSGSSPRAAGAGSRRRRP